MSFDEKYSKIKNTVKELSIIERELASCVNVKEPLNSHLKSFLNSPSKRIRSVLPILFLKANGEQISDKQLELFAAVELVHNASLIHDDIIDESNLRRGKETTKAKFGNKLGVISGDYLLSIAMDKIANLESTQILKSFIHTIKQMCIGEINQNFDRFKIGTIESYIEKSKNKTAFLFKTAFVCSILLAQKEYDLEKISELGLNIGIAFQIRDDLLNIIKTDNSKPSGSDISEGIYNAPIIFSGNVEDYTSGIEKTRDLLNNYIDKASFSIKTLPENEFKKNIINFLEVLRYE